MRQSEHDMIVGDGQQFGRALFQPALASCRLALGTMPIQTRVVGDGSLSAIITLLNVPAQRRGTTGGNGTQDLAVQDGQPAMMPFDKG